MKRLFALRGAVQCQNSIEDICNQVETMYDELLQKNNLSEDNIVSVIFSVTGDIDKVNPCSALRKNGRAKDLSLFSAVEPDCKNSLERVIRVLVHCYLEEEAKVFHVYRNGAEVLRPDRVNKT